MKESEIRPAHLLETFLALCAEDAVTYFSESPRQDIFCPACGENHMTRSFEKWGFGYATCDACGTLYQTPRPPVENFARFYQESPSAKYWSTVFFSTVAEARRMLLFRPKVDEIMTFCEKEGFSPGVVADVGAGFGLFLEEWRAKMTQARLIAIEPNPAMAEICRSKGLEVVQCFAEDASSLREEVDLIVALEVIEHVHDPLKFCMSLGRLLKSGGRILLTGLTVDGFDIQVLWDEAKGVSPPQHINFISVRGFKELMTRAGFKKVTVFTPGKLDVDIVKNALKERANVLDNQRFLNHLLGQEEAALKAFQEFLRDNQMSSHCWVWAEK